jgi:hypothetical protein
MKILSVLALILMAGCTVSPTMDELEAQAMLTGDWSAVERRENSVARRKFRIGGDCPPNHMNYCQTGMGDTSCSCIRHDSFEMMLLGY